MPVPNTHDLSMHELISANLMYFQLIEVAIREHFKLLPASRSAKFKGIIPKEKDTLGMLIKKFEKLNNNKELIEMLNTINEDRIYIAHMIWPHYLASLSTAAIESEGQDLATLNQAINEVPSSYLSDLKARLKKAIDCLHSLAEERNKLVLKEVKKDESI